MKYYVKTICKATQDNLYLNEGEVRVYLHGKGGELFHSPAEAYAYGWNKKTYAEKFEKKMQGFAGDSWIITTEVIEVGN